MAISNLQGFPTQNDVNAGTAGLGIKMLESNLRGLFKALIGNQNFIVSDTEVGKVASPSLIINIISGNGTKAVLGGVKLDGGTNSSNITLSASATRYIWLQLVEDGNDLVTGANLVETTTTSPPTGGASTLLAKCITSGSDVTTIEDHRTYAPTNHQVAHAWGRFYWNGGSITNGPLYGVSSISRGSTGVYTVTLSRPIVGSDNEVVAVINMGQAGYATVVKASATTMTISTFNNSAVATDVTNYFNFAVFSRRTLNEA